MKPLDLVVTKKMKFEVDNDFADGLEPQLMAAEKVKDNQQSEPTEQRDLYPHAELDDMLTPVRYRSIERGRSEDNREESTTKQ